MRVRVNGTFPYNSYRGCLATVVRVPTHGRGGSPNWLEILFDDSPYVAQWHRNFFDEVPLASSDGQHADGGK